MAWTAPRDWTAGEIVTASIMNTHVRDQVRYLKGLDGVPVVESGLTIDNTDGDERLLLPLLSTTECTTVLNAEGEIAHDETLHRLKIYDGTAVRSVVTTADVDDTPVNAATTDPISSNWAYDFQQALTTAGDLPYATGAGVWARLGIGTANQLIRTNAGATAPEWATISVFTNYGTYTGNSTVNRAIAHGLSAAPKIVLICASSYFYRIFGNEGTIRMLGHGGAGLAVSGELGVTQATSTNFYVGNATSYTNSANNNSIDYVWVAIT